MSAARRIKVLKPLIVGNEGNGYDDQLITLRVSFSGIELAPRCLRSTPLTVVVLVTMFTLSS